jgi:phosphonate transport system substrate-binding protein
MTTAPSASASPTFPWGRLFATVLLFSCGTLAVLGYFYYEATQSTPPPLNWLQHVAPSLTASTKLAKGLSDADGDLVADPPTDASAWLDPEQLVFGVLGPDLEAEQERWRDLLSHLEQATGKKVVLESMEPQSEQGFTPGSNVPAQRERTGDVRSGKLHIVSMNTGAVSLYVNEGGVVPVCVMADNDGKFGYRMQIIVPSQSAAKSVADLRGQRFVFATVTSHSAFRVPLATLWREFQLQPERDYQPVFLGNQEIIIRQLGSGTVPAAGVASDLLQRLAARGEIKPESFRVLHESGDFPPACFGYAHQLAPELATKIREAFLSFAFAGTSLEKAYSAAGQTKFVPVSYKEHWNSVRDTDAYLLELLKAKP